MTNISERPGPQNLGLLFTGSDTGVGKTFVMSAVARALRSQERRVQVCKPVASGAPWVEGRLLSEDTLCLARAAGATTDLERITPWTFSDPVAPPVAARRCGVQLTLEAIARAVWSQREAESILLVEAVGGLLCPVTENETVADLAATLGLPLVVVVRRSLGTLNHTLLTLEVARRRGLVVAGIVVNETERPCSLAEETNVEELERRIRVPLLAVVPHQEHAVQGEIASLAAVDWWQLAHDARNGRGELDSFAR